MKNTSQTTRQTEKKKRVPVTLMVVALPILLVFTTGFMVNAFHSLHPQRVASSPQPASLLAPPSLEGPASIQSLSLLEGQSLSVMEASQKFVTKKIMKKKVAAPAPMLVVYPEKIQVRDDGTTVKETFNENGKRVSKILYNAGGAVLNRWHFDPQRERIMRYETNEYKNGELTGRRIASWKYLEEGGFVKNNQYFDAQGRRKQSSTEFETGEKIKFREDWYDAGGRVLSEKRWDPETGRFVSSFVVKYLAGGLSKRIYLNSEGHAVREILFTSRNKVFKFGPISIGREI